MSTCLEKFGPSKWDITTSQVLEISNSKKPSRVGGPCNALVNTKANKTYIGLHQVVINPITQMSVVTKKPIFSRMYSAYIWYQVFAKTISSKRHSANVR